jgi:hypothetical protein
VREAGVVSGSPSEGEVVGELRHVQVDAVIGAPVREQLERLVGLPAHAAAESGIASTLKQQFAFSELVAARLWWCGIEATRT